MEWPTGNAYWGFSSVNDFVSTYCLEKARFHGCALGLENDKGEPIKKPWTIATDDEEVFFEMIRHQCRHRPCDHGECRCVGE